MAKKGIGILFIGVITYVLMAIYLLNVPFDVIPFPDIIIRAHKWIIFIAGLLLIVGGINYFRANKENSIFVG